VQNYQNSLILVPMIDRTTRTPASCSSWCSYDNSDPHSTLNRNLHLLPTPFPANPLLAPTITTQLLISTQSVAATAPCCEYKQTTLQLTTPAQASPGQNHAPGTSAPPPCSHRNKQHTQKTSQRVPPDRHLCFHVNRRPASAHSRP
jgi:hypothetical protein